MGSICNCLINPAWVMKNCPDESAKLLDKRSIVTRSISKIMFATGIPYYLVGFYLELLFDIVHLIWVSLLCEVTISEEANKSVKTDANGAH